VRTIIAAAIFTLILAVFCSPLAAQTARPVFLFSLEAKGVPTGTIHVYSVNASTGAITEVPGSPFNAGLIPDQLVVDPTGRFVYVTNDQSEDITAFSVDASTGALTELPGSPFPIGAVPVTSAVDPTGRFLYVFATNVINGVDEEFLYEYTIDTATGVLIAASSSPTTWEGQQGYLFVSIAFDPVGNYAYLGQVAGGNLGAPTFICSVDFSTGALTPVGSIQPAVTGEADHIGVSPSGSFLYSIDTTFSQADAFTIGSGGGFLSEISESPYSVPYGPSSLVVHPSGKFLYVANSNSSFQAPPTTGPIDGSIYAFAINSGTGALTQVSGSPYATGINPSSIVVDPTGSFAYWTSTSNTTGTPFAQIMGDSINSSSGVLTPLSSAPWTDSVTSNGDQLVVSHGPSTTTNPGPMISSLSPSSTTATAVAFTLQVNGANFVPGATVYFGGQPRSTTFVNSTQLNASILGSDINYSGTAVIFVFNPLPGGGASTSVEFPVSALSPIISSISPSSVTAGASPFVLFVTGSNFVTNSVVNFNGIALATSYGSPTLITVEISTAEIVAQGTASITVTSPSNGVPGGGTSNTVTLTILPPIVPLVVSNISPTSATVGGPAFTLTVNGSGFVQGSQVSFNLNNVTSTFVNSTQLTASIPASALAIAGNPYVIVTNPDGSTSVALTFTVNNPQPGGGSVSPPSLPAGSNALTLNVTGTGFAQGSVVLIGGNSRRTTYKSSTSLQATLLPSDLAQGGTLNITVMNPPPGGGTTGVISFTVADYSVTPPSSTPPVTAGQTAIFALTVSPSNGTFSNPVTFSVSPLPAGATASFASSATITPGGTPQTVTLSITTTPHTTASTTFSPRGSWPVLPLLCLLGTVIGLAGLLLRASGGRVRCLAPQLLLVLLLVAAAGLVACGAVGSGPSSPPQLNPATGTPAGIYTIQVIATSGAVSHSASITLTVM
jgi:6-phosphogluconolactonase (cycloisomerase 2 family)